MAALLTVVLPVFLVVGFGYGAAWRRLITHDAVDAIMMFSQNFAIPCLLFAAIARLDLGQNFDPRLLGSYYTGSVIGFAVGMLGARHLFRRPWQDSVAIGFCAMFANSVLMGLPLTQSAYGADALGPNYAIIALHAPFCYVLGFIVMETVRSDGGGLRRAVPSILRAIGKNALMMSIMLGAVVNLLSLSLPLAAWEAIELMARAALPAALFGLGGVLYRYRPEGDLATIGFICGVSLILHPTVVWMMGSTLNLSDEQFRSAVITAAMAPGVNTYIFANIYGVAKRVVASAVLIGTALSTVTAWVWIGLLP